MCETIRARLPDGNNDSLDGWFNTHHPILRERYGIWMLLLESSRLVVCPNVPDDRAEQIRNDLRGGGLVITEVVTA